MLYIIWIRTTWCKSVCLWDRKCKKIMEALYKILKWVTMIFLLLVMWFVIVLYVCDLLWPSSLNGYLYLSNGLCIVDNRYSCQLCTYVVTYNNTNPSLAPIIPLPNNENDTMLNYNMDDRYIVCRTVDKDMHLNKFYILDRTFDYATVDQQEIIQDYLYEFSDSLLYAQKCISLGIDGKIYQSI